MNAPVPSFCGRKQLRLSDLETLGNHARAQATKGDRTGAPRRGRYIPQCKQDEMPFDCSALATGDGVAISIAGGRVYLPEGIVAVIPDKEGVPVTAADAGKVLLLRVSRLSDGSLTYQYTLESPLGEVTATEASAGTST